MLTYHTTLGTTYHVNNLWYAVMRDHADNDWSYGSHDYNDALRMLKPYLLNDSTAYIAVIDDYCNDAICIDELHPTLEEVQA